MKTELSKTWYIDKDAIVTQDTYEVREKKYNFKSTNMKSSIVILLLLLPFICQAQKVTQIDSNHISVEGDTIIYFDAEQRPITEQMHIDSLETGKYIVKFKGSDEIAEIHLVYTHPKLETLIGKTLPQIEFSDINGNAVKMDSTDITVVCFWNRHCRPCIRELTVLDILAEDYPNIRFVAFTPDSKEEVLDLIKRLHLNWEEIIVVPGYEGEFTDTLRIHMYPSNVVVDKNRIIKSATVGGDTRQLLRTLERLSGDSKN